MAEPGSQPTSQGQPASQAQPTLQAQPTSQAQPISAADIAAAGILPASHWEPIEEEILDDGDSAYSDVATSTASLSNSILEYRKIHGRTYHSDVGRAEAWEPNDDQHAEAMDLHHHMCTLLLDGKPFLAPLKPENLKKIIDIGTGTGAWAIDFGDQFPTTEVIATDVSPIQPTWVPPNVKFELDDANLEWTWQNDTFDYVHLRCMLGTISNWSRFYREAFRCCKPGGWVEHHEESAEWRAEQGLPDESPMAQWGKVYEEGGKKFGRIFTIIRDDIQRKCMEEAGFVDIVVKDFKCPIGDWPKDVNKKQIGIFGKATLEADLEGYILYMFNAVMGWSREEIQIYLVHLRRQMRDRSLHTWYPHRVVYGRKPETA